jgi:hypothetical protein
MKFAQAFLIPLALLAACAHEGLKKDIAAPTGFVLVREYIDSVKTAAGDSYQKIQYGWDYQRGVAVQRFISMDGTFLSESLEPGLTLETTPAELEYAFALVRKDAVLASIVARKDARFYGGFSLRVPATQAENGVPADSACRAKSRCIHVVVSAGHDGEVSLAHAIVDLAAQKVVDPLYRGDSAAPTLGKK